MQKLSDKLLKIKQDVKIHSHTTCHLFQLLVTVNMKFDLFKITVDEQYNKMLKIRHHLTSPFLSLGFLACYCPFGGKK